MNEQDVPPEVPEQPGQPPSTRGWQIAVGVLALLLVAAVAFIGVRLLTDDDDAGSTTTTTAAGPESSLSDPLDVDCDADALLAAIPADVLADGAEVVQYQCAPATAGSEVQAYAWAQVESPGVEPLVAFFAGRTAAGADRPAAMDWEALTYGTDVVCLDVIPAESCDLLPEAPQRRTGAGTTGAPAQPSPTSAATPPGGSAAARVYRMECTPADLLGAVQPGVVADGATVTAFACTPSSLGNADSAYAFVRAEAPNVDPIYVLFSATALVEPGAATVVDWNPVTWGSAVVCDEHLPPGVCDQLAGVPRA